VNQTSHWSAVHTLWGLVIEKQFYNLFIPTYSYFEEARLAELPNVKFRAFI